MKKLVGLLAVVLSLVLVFAGCNKQTENAQADKAQAGKKVKLGIVQIVEHAALDASRKGFLDVLAENGYTKENGLDVDYQNAQGDQSNLTTIAQKFVTDKKDMILAIATPSAQAAAGQTADIPILITAVTDPVVAKLVDSNEHPGKNVTGTTDMTPVKQQLELLKKLSPNAKKVGVLYNSSEVNSQVQVDIAKNAAKDLGLEIVEATVTGSTEVMQVAQSLVGKVDALYVPTDNMIASSMGSVVSVAEQNKLALVVGESGMVKAGALATIGIDYYKLGRQTGEMALKVLKGEKKPADMAIEGTKDIDIVINLKAAERMGITVPQDILSQAKTVIK
jgi:putative ABC transport system substrate-binding protein